MAVTATTLTGAITASQTSFGVASATGITAPNFQTATGITYLFIDQEKMLVVAITGTFVSVIRGVEGTAAAAHVINSQVESGLPSDFLKYQEILDTELVKGFTLANKTQPAIFLAGTADALAIAPAFYVVKTAGVDAMTLAAPTAANEGIIIDVWSDTANAHTITATSLFANGTALKTTATFPAQRGAGVTLRACNLVWHVLSNGASAGVVVFT